MTHTSIRDMTAEELEAEIAARGPIPKGNTVSLIVSHPGPLEGCALDGCQPATRHVGRPDECPACLAKAAT